MPTRGKKESRINLLSREEFAATTLGRIFVWILSTFRTIVIVTEVLVMLAFLSRFWLDAKNTDLNELINQKQAVLASYSDFEKDFKDAQNRLKIFSDFAKDEGVISSEMDEIRTRLPPDVILTSVRFAENIEIVGESPSEISIQQFVVNLSSSVIFETVLISEIDTEEREQLLKFTIVIAPKS